jgi:hypothetical protein
MTTALILNLIFAAVVLVAIVGGLTWAMATQPRDRGVTLVRRSRRHRRAAAQRRSLGGALSAENA